MKDFRKAPEIAEFWCIMKGNKDVRNELASIIIREGILFSRMPFFVTKSYDRNCVSSR